MSDSDSPLSIAARVFAPDPEAKALKQEEIGHSPIFSPRFDGPFDPNPSLAQGRSPPVAPGAPASLLLSQSRLVVATLNVLDLEGMRAWYEKMFGMQVQQSFHRHGVLYEYLMGYPGAKGAMLALAKEPRPPGYNNHGRLGFDVPNAVALAEFLHAQGALMRVGMKGHVYFVIDPEGNAIEFFSLKRDEATASNPTP